MQDSLLLDEHGATVVYCVVDSTAIPYTEQACSDSGAERHSVSSLMPRPTGGLSRQKQTYNKNIEALIHKPFIS